MTDLADQKFDFTDVVKNQVALYSKLAETKLAKLFGIEFDTCYVTENGENIFMSLCGEGNSQSTFVITFSQKIIQEEIITQEEENSKLRSLRSAHKGFSKPSKKPYKTRTVKNKKTYPENPINPKTKAMVKKIEENPKIKEIFEKTEKISKIFGVKLTKITIDNKKVILANNDNSFGLIISV